MPSPAWEELDAFLDTDDFATEAIVTLQGGVSRPIHGIFDDPYLNAENGEYDFDTARPRLTCKEIDVLGVIRGDTCEIDGVTYDILSSPHSDGTGMAVLELAPQEAP